MVNASLARDCGRSGDGSGRDRSVSRRCDGDHFFLFDAGFDVLLLGCGQVSVYFQIQTRMERGEGRGPRERGQASLAVDGKEDKGETKHERSVPRVDKPRNARKRNL